jgi:hypothetical protein
MMSQCTNPRCLLCSKATGKAFAREVIVACNEGTEIERNKNTFGKIS